VKINLSDYQLTDQHDIKINGVQVVHEDKTTKIYTDPFRTVPVFLYQGKDNELTIFSDMEAFYQKHCDELIVDEVGFWEVLLYGNSIWTRTLFKNLVQIPAACIAIIDNQTEKYTVERYWDYCVQEDISIDSVEKAVEGLDFHLNRVFSKIDSSKQYVMGMSGGMDSRITLAYLSKFLPKENLQLFTYGFDERILEYKYAKEMARCLGFDAPTFHKLTPNSYTEALAYLPAKSGGQIGINHCHMIDFFKSNKLGDMVNISTYFTDALLGWECSENQQVNPNPYLETLNNNSFVPDSIKKEIEKDTQQLFSLFNLDSNISSIDEFKYVSERNQKFHTYLKFIQQDYIEAVNPYLDFDLFNYCLAIPRRFRANKKIIDDVFELKFKNISSRDFKNISSRFQWGASFSGQYEFYKFKLINRVNAFLRVLSLGNVQVFNPYQTEELERILYRDFKQELVSALDILEKKGLIPPEYSKEMKKLPIRSAGIGERYSIISLANIIE
jgi:asparagine synthetase B (glutamine-hydrolysing)